MSTREILTKAVEGMKADATVFINARNLREVAIEPGANIPADRPCAVKVGFLREKLEESGETRDSTPAVAEASTDVGQQIDDDETGEFNPNGEAVGQI